MRYEHTTMLLHVAVLASIFSICGGTEVEEAREVLIGWWQIENSPSPSSQKGYQYIALETNKEEPNTKDMEARKAEADENDCVSVHLTVNDPANPGKGVKPLFYVAFGSEESNGKPTIYQKGTDEIATGWVLNDLSWEKVKTGQLDLKDTITWTHGEMTSTWKLIHRGIPNPTLLFRDGEGPYFCNGNPLCTWTRYPKPEGYEPKVAVINANVGLGEGGAQYSYSFSGRSGKSGKLGDTPIFGYLNPPPTTEICKNALASLSGYANIDELDPECVKFCTDHPEKVTRVQECYAASRTINPSDGEDNEPNRRKKAITLLLTKDPSGDADVTKNYRASLVVSCMKSDKFDPNKALTCFYNNNKDAVDQAAKSTAKGQEDGEDGAAEPDIKDSHAETEPRGRSTKQTVPDDGEEHHETDEDSNSDESTGDRGIIASTEQKKSLEECIAALKEFAQNHLHDNGMTDSGSKLTQEDYTTACNSEGVKTIEADSTPLFNANKAFVALKESHRDLFVKKEEGLGPCAWASIIFSVIALVLAVMAGLYYLFLYEPLENEEKIIGTDVDSSESEHDGMDGTHEADVAEHETRVESSEADSSPEKVLQEA